MFPPILVTEKFLEVIQINEILLKIPQPLQRAPWGWSQIQRAQKLVSCSREASEIGSGAQKENTKPRPHQNDMVRAESQFQFKLPR